MTPEEYRAELRRMLLVPAREPYNGAQMYRDVEGEPHRIPLPEELSPEERSDFIAILRLRMGITIH